MFFIAYAFKRQVHVFAGRVKIVSHSSCGTSAIDDIEIFLSPVPRIPLSKFQFIYIIQAAMRENLFGL